MSPRRPGPAFAAALALIGLAAAAPRPAAACSCVPASREAQYAQATDVFVAKAAEGPKLFPGSDKPGAGAPAAMAPTTRQVTYTLEVVEVIKGAVTKGEVTIGSPSNAAACGVIFEPGKTYLVLARREAGKSGAIDEAAKDVVFTDLCMGNASGDQFDAAVAEMRQLAARTVVPSDAH